MLTTSTNRSRFAIAALATVLANGCSSNLVARDGGGGAGGQGSPMTDGGVLACPMSVAQACAPDAGLGCRLTWSAVLADSSLCAVGTALPRNLVFACGGYQVLSISYLDGGIDDVENDFYYDGTTGALVAIVGDGFNLEPCVAGPTAGFARPWGCTTTATPPPQCTGDAGT